MILKSGNLKFKKSGLKYWLAAAVFAAFLAVLNQSFALNIDKVKISFLSGNYKEAIKEGERLMAASGVSNGALEELYYLLGLCYLKDGNYLRASDIFEIIISEIGDSKFKDEAIMGLGDTYFLRGYIEKAEESYRKLLEESPKSKLVPQLLYRLSECSAKRGDIVSAKDYLLRLKKEYPANVETIVDKDLSVPELLYSVQVGAFTRPANANNLAKKLNEDGYDAYVEDTIFSGRKVYRVKVGKLKTRYEAAQLAKKLSQEGFPVKIIP